MRLAIRNGAEAIIEDLTQTFSFNLTSNGEANQCGAATVSRVSATAASHQIAFKSVAGVTEPWQNFTISEALVAQTERTVANTTGCFPQYRIKVLNTGTSPAAYVYWDDLVADLKLSYPTHEFTSVLNFETSAAELHVSLSYSDFETVKSRFTDAAGEVAMLFRVASFMPGSDVQGASLPDTQLIHADFKVVVVASDKVNECADLGLIDTGADHDGDYRYEDGKWSVEYQIATSDAAALNTVTIDANRIAKSTESCPTVTILELYRPVWNDEHDYMGGDYSEVRDDEYHTLNLDAAQPSVTF
jgi:hypothetical protein